MNKSNSNDTRMIDATLSIFNEHPGVLTGKPILNKVLTDLRAVRLEIKNAAKDQKSLTAGMADEKEVQKEALIFATLDVCTALVDYGTENEMPHIVAIADLDETDLSGQRETELPVTCEVLYDAANELGSDLISYGLDSYDLEAYGEQVEAYKALLERAQGALADRIAVTSEIPVLIRKAKNIMKTRMDRQMKKFRKSNPEVFKAYRSARKIRHFGVRHDKPVDGTVGDSTEVAG